jgi:hypothetical protein
MGDLPHAAAAASEEKIMTLIRGFVAVVSTFAIRGMR